MARGRLPSTKYKIKKKDFFPLRRCRDCPRKWKGTEKDKRGKVVRVMSCVESCFYMGYANKPEEILHG